MIRMLVVAAGAALIAGCQNEPVREFNPEVKGLFQSSKGADALAQGVQQYDNAAYGESAKSFQSALDQGLPDRDKVTAHKYLAFIHCGAGRITPCREEFRKALAVDPQMQLSAAEAGHPTWGPVFRNLKAGK